MTTVCERSWDLILRNIYRYLYCDYSPDDNKVVPCHRKSVFDNSRMKIYTFITISRGKRVTTILARRICISTRCILDLTRTHEVRQVRGHAIFLLRRRSDFYTRNGPRTLSDFGIIKLPLKIIVKADIISCTVPFRTKMFENIKSVLTHAIFIEIKTYIYKFICKCIYIYIW